MSPASAALFSAASGGFFPVGAAGIPRPIRELYRADLLREYLAVASIHTYVIVEQSSIGLTVLRRHQDNAWIAMTLTAEDVLRLHEPEVEIPVPELYENVDLPDAENL
jgi:hypothetical protein